MQRFQAMTFGMCVLTSTACALDTGEGVAAEDSISVDQEVYTRAEFSTAFGDRELHWVLTEEVLDEGIPTAFTSEELRDAFVGREAALPAEPAPGLAATYATLYRNTNRGGQVVNITGHAYNLGDQSFNDAASSVDTFSRDIVLYEHANHLGCSLFVQRQKYISSLGGHDFCGVFTGSWNDKTSSVAVAGL